MAAILLICVLVRDHLDARPKWARRKAIRVHQDAALWIKKEMRIDESWDVTVSNFFSMITRENSHKKARKVVVREKDKVRGRKRKRDDEEVEYPYPVGTRVTVAWADGYYQGKVAKIDNNRRNKYFIQYDDGDEFWEPEFNLNFT